MIKDESLNAWLTLSLIRGLGGESARHLLKEFGSPDAVLAASVTRLKSFVKPELSTEIRKGINDEALKPTLKWLKDSQNCIVTLADHDYPQALLNINDPPLLLYVKGRRDLLNTSSLAIVGSRNATPQGINNAEEFSHALSDASLCIISGMAHGIDAAAHRGALRGQGRSIAIVGTGLDRIYPAANRELAHALALQGTLISEFPLGTPPIGNNFPRRNRLISGMSLGCLVVEAALRSGSLITARLSMEQGRDVFAIPGSIHTLQSKGCHSLIKQGAKLVESAQDILEELAPLRPFSPRKFDTPQNELARCDLDPLCDLIGFDPVDVNTLCLRSGLTVSQLSAMLLTLELAGSIAALPGGLFQRIH